MENTTFDVSSSEPHTNTTGETFEVYPHYYMRQIVATMCAMTSIVGLIANSTVICAVPLSKKLRTVTNVFVINLSVGDLLANIFLPWQAVAVLSTDGWPLPRAYWLCVATGSSATLSGWTSIFNLALIALNRWVGITKPPATTRRIYSRRNVTCMVALSWAIPFTFAVIFPLLGLVELGYEPLYSMCSWLKKNPYAIIQNVVILCFVFPIPLVVICACYISIFRYVLKTSRRMARQETPSVSSAVSKVDPTMRNRLWKRQIAVTKNLVYIVVAYIICGLPFYFAAIPLGFDWSIRITPFAGAFFFLNTCLNPFIYASSHPDFKEAFSFMVRCRFQTIPQSQVKSLEAKMKDRKK